jgi:acetylornithine/N-succinyldiaminopimelate aminotransferase
MEELSKPGFLAQVAETGAYLAERLTQISRKHGSGGVRGRGLLLALDLERPVGSQIVERARDRGLLINAPRPDCLRFMPALTVSRAEIDRMIAILDDAMADVGAPAMAK